MQTSKTRTVDGIDTVVADHLAAPGAMVASVDADGVVGPARLGQILVLLGMVHADDVTVARYEQEFEDDRELGEILVASGQITSAQRHFAVSVQQDVRQRFSAVTALRERGDSDLPIVRSVLPDGGRRRLGFMRLA